MRVQWALLARYAEQQHGLYTMVGAGIDAFYPQGLPTLIQAFLVVQFRFGVEEVGAAPELEFVVRDEQTQVVGKPVPVKIDPLRLNANHPPGLPRGHRTLRPVRGSRRDRGCLQPQHRGRRSARVGPPVPGGRARNAPRVTGRDRPPLRPRSSPPGPERGAKAL